MQLQTIDIGNRTIIPPAIRGGMLEAIRARLADCGLELHPTKTKIVYCKDNDRRGTYENIKFDFLGYSFHPRRAKNLWGTFFVRPCLFLTTAVDDGIVSVPLERIVREGPPHPHIERVMQEEIRQEQAYTTTLRGAFCPLQ